MCPGPRRLAAVWVGDRRRCGGDALVHVANVRSDEYDINLAVHCQVRPVMYQFKGRSCERSRISRDAGAVADR